MVSIQRTHIHKATRHRQRCHSGAVDLFGSGAVTFNTEQRVHALLEIINLYEECRLLGCYAVWFL
jgi:hypothetical protein